VSEHMKGKFKNFDAIMRTMLKQIWKKKSRTVKAGFIWLRIATSGST